MKLLRSVGMGKPSMRCLQAIAGWLMVDRSSHFEGPGKKLKNIGRDILLRQRMGYEDWLNSSSWRERESVPFREYIGPRRNCRRQGDGHRQHEGLA